MNTKRTILIWAVLLSIMAGCEWPPDPPLKSTATTPPPPDRDTTNVLLPLDAQLQWTYTVNAKGQPPQGPRTVSPVPITWNNEQYAEVEYIYQTNHMRPPVIAFPPILKNSREGLDFYLLSNPADTVVMSGPPLHIFHLPYPAEQGATWSDANREYAVQLMNKDTLVTERSGLMTFRVWRYHVTWRNQFVRDIYAIPGVALLRIEDDFFAYHTIGWTLKQ